VKRVALNDDIGTDACGRGISRRSVLAAEAATHEDHAAASVTAGVDAGSVHKIDSIAEQTDCTAVPTNLAIGSVDRAGDQQFGCRAEVDACTRTSDGSLDMDDAAGDLQIAPAQVGGAGEGYYIVGAGAHEQVHRMPRVN